MHYTDEVSPDPEAWFLGCSTRSFSSLLITSGEQDQCCEALVQSCIEGPYDSVCGDREKTRGTYRQAKNLGLYWRSEMAIPFNSR